MELIKLPLIILIFLFPCNSSVHGLSEKRSFEFSIVNRVNQTGHLNVEVSMTQGYSVLKRQCQVKVNHEVITDEGIEKLKLKAYISEPPPLPKDYKLFPGIGYYKFHTAAVIFTEAMDICMREGGHLAIINSKEEANALINLYRPYPPGQRWPLLGYYDLSGNGTYVTIFGQPMESIGYTNWHREKLDYSKGLSYCGTFTKDGRLAAGNCDATRAFFCEYELF